MRAVTFWHGLIIGLGIALLIVAASFYAFPSATPQAQPPPPTVELDEGDQRRWQQFVDSWHYEPPAGPPP